MSQHDFSITVGDANTGLTIRAAFNAALQALASCSSGTSEPTTPYPHQFWADTTANLLKQRNTANSAWVTLAALDTAYFGLVSLASAQTITGVKTFTGVPVIGQINDTNGNEILVLLLTASAVNHFQLRNSATGANPTITALGDDTNVGINLVPKGTGVIQVSGIEIVTLSATQTLTNKTLTSPTLVTPTIASFANAAHNHLNAAGGGTLGADSVDTVQIVALAVDTVELAAAAVTGAKDSKAVASDGNQVIATVSSWTPSAGMYNIVPGGSGDVFRIYVSASWRGYTTTGVLQGGSLFCDGTNMQVYNASGVSHTVYYQTR